MDIIPIPKRYLNPDELAEYLRLSKKTVYRLVDQRLIPFIKPGGVDSLRFDIKAIDKWMEKQMVRAVSPVSRANQDSDA